MTQESKELLLRDLSARLTYGVIVDYKEDENVFHHWKIVTLHSPGYGKSGTLINSDSDGWIEYNEYEGCGMSSYSRQLHLGETLPFLRSMSSMTEEERNEYLSIKMQETESVTLSEVCRPETISEIMDWLNKHYFDYRGLIEKGLAVEAPKGMYDIVT